MRIDINFTSASSSSSSSLSSSLSHSSVSSKQPPLNAQERQNALRDILGNAKLSAKNDSGLKMETDKKGLDLKKVTDKKDLNSGTYWFPADTSSVSFEIDETTEIGKRIIEAIYETSAKHSSKLTISPLDKGFKSKLDIEREELEKTEKSFNSGAFVRKDDRPNVINYNLPNVKDTEGTPWDHMLLPSDSKIVVSGDKDSGYLSLFEYTSYDNTLRTVNGAFIHVLFIPKTVRITSLDTKSAKSPITSPDNTAQLLKTIGVEKLFLQNKEGEQIKDNSGTRMALCHEDLFCGRWPIGIEEISFKMGDMELTDILMKHSSPPKLYFYLTKAMENKNGPEGRSHLKVNQIFNHIAGNTSFLEIDVPKDGSCGFHSLGVTRKELSQELRKLTDDDEKRRDLAEEIREAIIIGAIPQTEKTRGITLCEDKLRVFDARLNSIMANIKSTLIAQFTDPLIESFNADQLIDYMKNNPDEKIKAITSKMDDLQKLIQANESVKKLDSEIKNDCASKEMFGEYLKDLEGTTWLGYKSALLYATSQGIRLDIWHPDSNVPNNVKLHLTNADKVPSQKKPLTCCILMVSLTFLFYLILAKRQISLILLI